MADLQLKRRAASPRFRRFAALFVSTLFISLIFFSCNSTKKVPLQSLGQGIDSMYQMLTRDVDMLVSDSGLTKYRLRAPIWILYDRSDRKEWLFTEGILLTGLKETDTENAKIKADTAIYLVDQDEWQLHGHVEVWGPQGDQLFTPHLYWKQKERMIYSYDTTYLASLGKELRGDRFSAKDDLSDYTIYNSSGAIDYTPSNSSARDSLRLKREEPDSLWEATAVESEMSKKKEN